MNFQKILDTFTYRVPTALFLHGADFTEAEKGILKLFEDCSDGIVLRKPKVEELKNLAQWISLQPSKKYKVIELHDIDQISKEATNYLLKAIEDSPRYLKWVLYSRIKYLNKALLSRCCVIPVTIEVPRIHVTEFDQVKDYGAAYAWLVKTKDELSDASFKESLLGVCDMLLQKQTNFDKIHLVQKYKNLIDRESSGFENSFKFLLTHVF